MPSTVWPVAAVLGAPVGVDGFCWLNRYTPTKITTRATTVIATGSSQGGMVDRLTGRLRAGGGGPPACGRCPGRGGAAVRFLLMARPPILHARRRASPDNRPMIDGDE